MLPSLQSVLVRCSIRGCHLPRRVQVILNEKGREGFFWSRLRARVHYIQEGIMLQAPACLCAPLFSSLAPSARPALLPGT